MATKRLNTKQLRQLVENVIKESSASTDVAAIWGEAACQAIEEHCSDVDNIAALIDEAVAMSGADAPYPARIEDVEAFAAKAASYAAAEMHLTLAPVLEMAITQALRRSF